MVAVTLELNKEMSVNLTKADDSAPLQASV